MKLHVLGLFGYLVIVGFVFGGSLFPEKNQILFGPDIWRYHYYQKLFLWDNIQNGDIPWWNPYTFSGVPYIEHPQSIPWYPGNIIFILFPTNMAFSWYFATHILIAMLGMYRLCRIWTGRFPAWIAGVVFGLSGFFAGRIYAGHIDIIAETSWMPWVFTYSWLAMSGVGLKRLGYRIRSAIIAGFFVAMQIFAGYITFAIFTVYALIVAMIVQVTRKRTFVPLFYLILTICVGLGIGAIQILPNYQFIHHSIRTLPPPTSWSTLGTPVVANIVELVDPFFFYNMLPIEGLGHEHAAYLGKLPLIIVVAIILWAIVKRKKNIELWFFIILALLAWWIALGSNVPFDLFAFMQRWVPFYGQIRIPPRQLVWFVLSGAALCGLGLHMIRNKKILGIIAILILIDLMPFARGNVHLGPVPETGFDPKLIENFTQKNELYRILPNFFHGDLARDNFEFNTPMLYKAYSVSGYDSPPLRNYWEFLMAVNHLEYSELGMYTESIPPYSNLDSKFTDFLNIAYVWVPIGEDSVIGGSTSHYTLVLDDVQKGYRVYKNTSLLPRFFVVPEILEYPTRQDLVAAISAGVLDPEETVGVVGSEIPNTLNLQDCTSERRNEVNVLSYGLNSIELDVRTACDAVLTSSEVMYPGWTATIDGVKAQLFEGNLAFRTLLVPKGDHTIILAYKPVIVFVGGFISAMSLLGIVILLRYAKNK